MKKEDSLLGAYATKGASSEARHAAEKEQTFLIEARRNKRLALWIAGLIGFDEDDRRKYVDKVIAADLARPGPEDLIAGLMADLKEHGIGISEADLRAKMGEIEMDVRRELGEDR